MRFTVDDPEDCERRATENGLAVIWPVQDASWGRFSSSLTPMAAPSSWPRWTVQPRPRRRTAEHLRPKLTKLGRFGPVFCRLTARRGTLQPDFCSHVEAPGDGHRGPPAQIL